MEIIYFNFPKLQDSIDFSSQISINSLASGEGGLPPTLNSYV